MLARRRHRSRAHPRLRALQPDRRAVDGGRHAGGGVAGFSAARGLRHARRIHVMFYAYAALGLVCALLYRRCRTRAWREAAPQAPLGPSRGVVYKLAALFSLDAFAGGFIVQSLLALWLFERFDLSISAASVFFFWSSVLSALLLSGGGMARPPLRAGQHHGVYPHSLEHLLILAAFLVQPRGHARACCWSARRCRRWMCRRAPPTSWRW